MHYKTFIQNLDIRTANLYNITYDDPVSRANLEDFFNVKPRGLRRILTAFGIGLVAGHTRWVVIFNAFGFSKQCTPHREKELMEGLLTAGDVADRIGLADTSTVYKWVKGKGPQHFGPFPKPIDLRNGTKGGRAMRWRRAEIDAWLDGRPQPKYDLLSPVFGALPSKTGGVLR
ncbi:MAG: AlpA family phage regulatory protein [Sulfitobacter sp.]|nr:AlpA family phage regulatory protein [Sulfitobacter sp.]